MIENTLEVGPFTPQELETTCEKLKSQGVDFEIIKDEEKEKSEMKSDYLNVVKKTEYRLETYLGQVFYLRLKVEDFDRNKSLFEEFGMATTHKENPAELQQAEEISQVIRDSKEQKRLQRLVARALVILAASIAFYFVGKYVQSLIFDLPRQEQSAE